MNYWPVSLTSVVSKVLEKVLRFHLYKHLSTSDLLSNAQHGFHPVRSCESLLLESVHEWAKTLHEKGTTDVIFLDISKAFDTVTYPPSGETEKGGYRWTGSVLDQELSQ